MSARVVAGLLLAAGEGARLGRPKAVIELGGETLARRGARLLRAGGCAPVLVVLGAADTAVPDARIVRNPDWRSGMGSSLRAGLEALDGAADGPDAVVVALADQPLVSAEAVRRLRAAHADGARVAAATYNGAVRNPVLLGREHWPAVRAMAEGDVGARPFLRSHPDVTEVPCDGIAAADDIDTADDLARLRELLNGSE
ncbi:nicotine blue oxidoreductase [Murinocardiopsis flavida]|uniref:Nicotine blue oxidoreductase n=1 Tax=Murinocardiopsis flavida TaxID=645275 RepID=A0A2P8DHZ4_9ACTN|nr:nucleotidyltransferase family protein [Murinocardiopsis flavida]PSK96833.1 nicotine blue oxidoreductase [Murinocardiopsis flavida]